MLSIKAILCIAIYTSIINSIMSIQIGDSSFKIQLYLVRHGETTANRDDILQGHCDYPLTEQGIKQAEYCGIGLKDIEWYQIYSSDLFRAYNTCCLILSHNQISENIEEIKKNVIQSKLIRELNFGVREALPRSITKGEALVIVSKRDKIPIKDIIDTTESFEDVYIRQQEFLTTLGKDLYQQQQQYDSNSHIKTDIDRIDKINIDNPNDTKSIKKILCLSHGGYIKQFLKNYCKNILTPDRIHNCGVSILTIEWPNVIENPSIFTCTTSQEYVNINYDPTK